jgi:hypothetical protein
MFNSFQPVLVRKSPQSTPSSRRVLQKLQTLEMMLDALSIMVSLPILSCLYDPLSRKEATAATVWKTDSRSNAWKS